MNASIEIIDESYLGEVKLDHTQYAWWDVLRLKRIIDILIKTGEPVVHCDMDVIIEKDIQPLINMEGDFIISTEIGGAKSFPKECSSVIGFGVCSGFYICKPSALTFLIALYKNMYAQTFGSYSDQVNIMNMIVKNEHSIKDVKSAFDGIEYTNKLISMKEVSMCVLDFGLIARDPEYSRGQFANHINIDNVGGYSNFIRYFYEPLEELPVTCRCGKLGIGLFAIIENECIL